jgi:hypothetical protein
MAMEKKSIESKFPWQKRNSEARTKQQTGTGTLSRDQKVTYNAVSS